MSTSTPVRKTPVDYGVQIRFINDLHDTGGGGTGSGWRREGPTKSSRYGVAVRVQGIAGHPYVVLKEGEKGDSYGVQLRSQPHCPPPAYGSLPRRRDDGHEGLNPSLTVADGHLRRAHSHGSLLDRDEYGHESRRPPGDGHSGSYGSLDASGGRPDSSVWGGSLQAGLNGTPERPPLRGYGASPEPTPDDPRGLRSPANRPLGRFNRGGAGTEEAVSVGGSTRGSSSALESANRPQLVSSAPPTTLNAYNATPPAPTPASAYGSMGRSSGSVAKVTALPSSGLANVDSHVTPDLLMDQGQSSGSDLANEDDQIQQIIRSVLQQGSSESDATIKRRARIICDKIQRLQVNRAGELKGQLDKSLDENVHLQEQLSRKKAEQDHTHSELALVRMERENAETLVRQLEDQLAGLQEELRKEDLPALRTELADAAALHQRQEEVLRQRERELTALKGALKEEVSTHDREMETLRDQYSQDMERLRSSMEQVSQSQASIEAERLRVNTTVRSLQKELEDSREEGAHWREQLQSSREELRHTKQELLQTRVEKEELEEELTVLQETLNTVKKNLPDAKHTQAIDQELERCRADLKKAQADVDKLKVDLDKKTMEIISLKKANQEQDAEQKYEIDRLKNQSRRDKEELTKVQEKAKLLADPSLVQSLREELSAARGNAERLRVQLLSAEEELQKERGSLGSAHTLIQTLTQEQEAVQQSSARLTDRAARLEAQLQEQVSQTLEAEQELQEENRRLRLQLEEARRERAKLGQHRDELVRTLEERDGERDALRKENTLLDEEKRQQERTLDKLNKEIERLSADSSQSVQAVQAQLTEQRDKWRREQQDLQKAHKDQLGELERAQLSVRSLQDELARQKKELLLCCEERDNGVVDRELLLNRLRHLETELESQKNTVSDRARDMRSMEDKVKHLELELDEEKNSVELLTDRITRSREQIEQLRSELMQERSSKQDLELDKNALERQLKELRCRVIEMEGQSRGSSSSSQLEAKLQELEERLRNEERDRNSAQSSQRRLERKLKELSITLDEEKQQLSEQRDQLALRVKALKRKVDEGEEEMERLEGLRRKAVRDLEDQQEQKEALQTRVAALENELKRKSQQARHNTMDSSALSSDDDDDDDGLYDPSSITSILTEGNLKTSSC
ncbi:cingulin isoform X2 [Brachyhypopomus gauderio]|uniref:cingulin isoform X2 n=1 Tax=Brachyhypopomus gauderio TaxID=698409 RepID=UPI0040436566